MIQTKITKKQLDEAGITQEQLNDWANKVSESSMKNRYPKRENFDNEKEYVKACINRDGLRNPEEIDFKQGNDGFIYLKSQLFAREVIIRYDPEIMKAHFEDEYFDVMNYIEWERR